MAPFQFKKRKNAATTTATANDGSGSDMDIDGAEIGAVGGMNEKDDHNNSNNPTMVEDKSHHSYFKDERSSTAITPENDNGSHSHGHHGNNGNKAQSWGRGIRSDFQTTIQQHWKHEMINFNFKTIGVSLFLFIAVIAPR